MVFDFNTMEITDKNNLYKTLCKDSLVCYFRGFIWSKETKSEKDNIQLILKQYEVTGKIDFNMFYGAYHIILIDKKNNDIRYFGDNAGFCCFYYNKEQKLISDSFLELIKASINVTPNYGAITEFIHFNCIYSNDTICEEIFKTDAMNWYALEEFKFESVTKKLEIWQREGEYETLNAFISDTVSAAEDLKIVDIITGGVDSRVVLAHLNSLKIKFELAISGNKEMIDVKIAEEIADELGMGIYISDEKINDSNWVQEAFVRSDGVYGAFSRYRLHKKNIMLQKLGFQLELGGVGGEFYKNSFINQDFPFYNVGKINKKKFYKLKMNPNNWGRKYLTEDIMKYEQQMETNIIDRLFENEKGSKSKIYFRIGHKVMRHRMITLSNSNNLSIPSISPFVEIDMMKLTYNKNPWKLEVNKWQRDEVSKYCPKISAIKTDRKLTLQNNKVQVLKEFVLSYIYLIKVAFKRLWGGNNNNSNQRLEVYIEGRKFKEFKEAMNKCKTLNIINKKCSIEEIPDVLADRLMTIGLVFMNKDKIEK